jgi:3-carboxy-cis,cis-muconate cycloisomerase
MHPSPFSAAELGLLSPGWASSGATILTGDAALTRALLVIEREWIAAQVDAGLATDADTQSAAAVIDEWEPDLAQLAARGADGANVLIPLLADFRARLMAASGGPVAALHRGATSQDVIDTALVLVTRAAGEDALTDLRAASEALAGLAERHRGDVCIARSLTQHALPITIGHRVARWMVALDDAAEALEGALASLPLQWGGAVGTLASLTDTLRSRGDADPEGTARALVTELARRLGLAVPPTAWHTRRSPLTRAAAALAETIAACGKLASDVLILARPEIAELAEPHAPGKGTSSAMPHKRNPVLSVLIKEAALEAPGHLSTLFLAAGQAVDERPDGAWHAEWQALRSLLRLAAGAAAKTRELAEGLRVFPQRSLEVAALFGDAILSERLAARLGQQLPGGKARLEELVAASLDGGTPLRPALRAELPAESLSDEALDELLDPSGYLGLAPTEVDALVALHHARKDTTA